MVLGDEDVALSLLNEFPARTNILVVDSSLVTLLDMKKTMKQFAYQVTIIPEAEEAIAFLKNSTHEINLVIWDFHMPKIHGLEALKIIGSKMDLPVVIMSDDSETESVMKATMHGACDYVMKPVSEQVIANIWQHIVRKKLMDKPDSVQSDLAQSHGLEQGSNDPKTMGQDNCGQNTDLGDKAQMIWSDLDLPFQSELDQTNSLFLDNDDLKIIYQDNGEQHIDEDGENAAKKPRVMSTDSVQSNLVETDVLDLDNSEQGNDKKEGKRPRKLRMTWTKDLHQKFLEAIEIGGGIEKANPMLLLKYLQEMNIKGLSRTNVASHLQKHRLHLDEKRIPQRSIVEIGRSTGYKPLSLLGPSNAHTAIGRSTACRPSSLLGPSYAHTDIGTSTAYRPSSLLTPSSTQIAPSTAFRSSLLSPSNTHTAPSTAYRSSLLSPSNTQTEIGRSTAYRSSSLLGPSNAYTASPSLMNGRDMNQIHQNQYPNGYMTTNNNQFMANTLPCLPYVDNHHDLLQQQQQQQPPQYQLPNQMNYVMNAEEPEQAYGTDNGLIYPELPYDPNDYLLKGNHFYQ